MTPERSARLVRFLRGLGVALLRLPRPVSLALPLLWGWLIWGISSQRVPLDIGSWGPIPLLGNLAHAFEFGVLAILCLPQLRRADGWVVVQGPRVLILVVLCLLYGFLDEFHQSWVPGRSASLLDWGTDGMGVLASLALVRILGQRSLTQARLLWALGVGVLACTVMAGIATAWDATVGHGAWPFGESAP